MNWLNKLDHNILWTVEDFDNSPFDEETIEYFCELQKYYLAHHVDGMECYTQEELDELYPNIPKAKLYPIPNPDIWGNGWYAILSEEEHFPGFWFAPIDFYDKNGHCPDGLEFLSEEMQEKYQNICADMPIELPEGFECTMEGFAEYTGNEDPVVILREAGFEVVKYEYD